MTYVEYNSTTATADFVIPINSGTAPIHSATTTTAHIAENIHIHGGNCRDFQLYHGVYKSLWNQLVFFQELQDSILGLGQVTCLQMLTRLHETYSNITQANMDHN